MKTCIADLNMNETGKNIPKHLYLINIVVLGNVLHDIYHRCNFCKVLTTYKIQSQFAYKCIYVSTSCVFINQIYLPKNLTT